MQLMVIMETVMVSAPTPRELTMAIPDTTQQITNMKHRTTEDHAGHTVILPITKRWQCTMTRQNGAVFKAQY